MKRQCELSNGLLLFISVGASYYLDEVTCEFMECAGILWECKALKHYKYFCNLLKSDMSDALMIIYKKYLQNNISLN